MGKPAVPLKFATDCIYMTYCWFQTRAADRSLAGGWQRDNYTAENGTPDEASNSKDHMEMRAVAGVSRSKHQSVRRLLSNSSVSTAIAEDQEVHHATDP